ncbi:exodeoxyribonuclease V subunit alpha [Thalassomonas sp. M1454]|uniref:exodeoxyribonuclease V subunit alpha n=1 Tax=Thalassomonas sp. M1454 TaxID=2594477 RepID=UPI00117DBBA7|nr:exodeoxyribonuclease V subunit alpha [Thalassomonas sp. M1454]TRX56781.1 exodeoxyribonuclease V subunit alpha [Thalassomonas sp. M1454]
MSNLDNMLVYKNFNDAQQALSGIEAIDYYLAQSVIKQCPVRLNEKDTCVLFHLVLALSESQRNGHSCLDLAVIANNTLWQEEDSDINQGRALASASENLKLASGFLFPDLTCLLELLTSYFADVNSEQAMIVLEFEHLYLRRYWLFEQQLACFINDKIKQVNRADIAKTNEIINHLFGNLDANIDWQLISVANALNKNFAIIAGGPGTGKTYTVTKLLAGLLMQQPTANIAMVAPTGKASQRLTESIVAAVNSFKDNGDINPDILDLIPSTASTIHRLLGVIKNSPNFRHDQHNKLNCDVLLIDEVSMVDLPMMTRIFRALPTHAKVILLGDADQLPSVATGSVLADLAPWPTTQYSLANKSFIEQVSSQQLPDFEQALSVDYLTYLTFSRRFSGEGGIGKIAKLVIAGEAEQSWQLLNEQGNQELSFVDNKTLDDYVKQLTNDYYAPIFEANSVATAFDVLENFRILAPSREGEYGLENLNNLVEQQLAKQNCISANSELYHGKPIMISQNHYGVGLFNGDIGLLFKDDTGRLMAYFADGDSYRALSIARLPSFETVYAMTIHKTQGSEFNNVALILPNTGNNRLLSRELIYTGITRAKSHLQIFTGKDVWYNGVKTKVSRASGLTKRLFNSLK